MANSRSMPKPTGRFRIRRGWFGKAILQRGYLEDDTFASWDDVSFDNACPVLLIELNPMKDFYGSTKAGSE